MSRRLMGGLGAGAFDLEEREHYYYFNLGRQEESK
jgi:hypothetical protein